MNYNVYLLDNNKGTENYFTNDQIKFALIKDGTFVANTTGNVGRKLTDVSGFNSGEYTGEGLVLENQEIASGKRDEYKLRIWISDDVNYSNTSETSDDTDENNDSQISNGKFNSYKYSLKVKVTSGVIVDNTITNLKVNKLTITADLEDFNGLSSYAVTENKTAPLIDSTEWIEIKDETAKSNILRTSSGVITNSSIKYMVKKNGTYYLHVKNVNDEVKSKLFVTSANGENAVEKIVSLAQTNTNELRIDEHAATGQQSFATTEYRYWGTTPNNYVWFNNELWRIVGAMDVDDGATGAVNVGNVEKRLKIVRDESIGNYPWDTSDSSINTGFGINEWTQADLMNLLNSGAYYNRTTDTCYTGLNNGTNTCDFSKNGLDVDAKEMIGNAKWYLGAHGTTNVTTSEMYGHERGNETGKKCSSGMYCNDKVSRTTVWVGQVGLMYPSDYGYSGNITTCDSSSLKAYSTCLSTGWLSNNSIYRWTITPYGNSTVSIYGNSAISNYAFIATPEGNLAEYSAGYARGVNPTVYLLPSINILDGDGTTERPFVLSK